MKRIRRNRAIILDNSTDRKDLEALICDDLNGHEETVRTSSGRSALKTILMAAGFALGATAAINSVIALRTPPLNNRLGGTFNRYPTRHGDVAYTVSGSGSPVLLLHGLGAGNSMAEWVHNFEELARHHTVYALDLLGWGLSDKTADAYTAEDFIEQVQFFAEDIIGQPCALIASSHSCGFAVEAAQRAPHLFSKLVLICPANSTDGHNGVASDVPREAIISAFRWPIIGQALYNSLVSRVSIEKFARHYLYFDKERVNDALVTRYHVTAHQKGAKTAVASFLAGLLDVDWQRPWEQLQTPALLVWGRNTLLNGLDTAPEWLALKPDARLSVMDRSMLLPHVEHPEEFHKIVLEWLAQDAIK